jgi:lipopolysaccharide heptosyltransferase I
VNKIQTLPELRTILAREKKKGRTIVLANGCFDLIHAGHVRYLREAKSRGDLLVVAINSDSSVRRLKGTGRPLLPEADRAEILAAFSFVDYVTVFDEPNVERLLLALKPDVHAKGSDYTRNTVPEKETARKVGARVAITGGPKIRNTSDIIRSVVAASGAKGRVPRSFLIIRLGSLGDIIHTLPAFASLRRHFPQARISWAVGPRGRAILECVPGLDDILVIRRGKLLWNTRGLRQRDRVALDFQGLMKSGLVAELSRARTRIGFSKMNLREHLASIFYTHRVGEVSENMSVIRKNLKLLEPLGIKETRLEFPLRLPAPAVARVRNELRRLGYRKGRRLVVCNLGAAWKTKRWPAARWTAFLQAMKKKRPGFFYVLLWGTKEEAQAAAEVGARTCTPLVPFLSVVEVMALLKETSLLVSGDTFALQAAGALGTPVVGLFGPTNPRRNGPFRPADLYAYHRKDCAPCYRRECRRGVCLGDIGTREVVALALKRMRSAGRV